jgi:hypothetical protein
MQATKDRPAWKTCWLSRSSILCGDPRFSPFVLASAKFRRSFWRRCGSWLRDWSLRLDDRAGRALAERRQWMSASLLALLIFVLDYGLLFWAEQRVPSGIAAVMMATIPVFMALSEIIFLRTQRLTVRLALALSDRDWRSGGADEPLVEPRRAPIDRVGAVALIVAAMSWSVSRRRSRASCRCRLPKS